MTILGWLIEIHTVVIKVLLFTLLLIVVVPNFFKKSISRLIFYTRVGYFAFWAVWSAVVFNGLLLLAIERGRVSVAIIAMITASIAIALLEAYRAITLKKIWQKEQNGLKFSNIILLIELVIVVAVTVLVVKFK